MKLESIIYDIRHIFNQQSGDTSIRNGFIENRIHMYRAEEAIQYAMEYGHIPEMMYQNFKNKSTDVVNSADISSITKTSVVLSKYSLPTLIPAPYGMEIKRITSSSQQKDFCMKNERSFYKMIELNEDFLKFYTIYYLNGNEIFFYPHIKNFSCSLLLENPLDGETTNEFVTPQGKTTSSEGTNRNINIGDNYPITATIAVRVILSILTKDFNIKLQTVKDIVADNQDQLEIMKNEGGKV